MLHPVAFPARFVSDTLAALAALSVVCTAPAIGEARDLVGTAVVISADTIEIDGTHMRRYRERLRDGMRCLWVELHDTEIDVLVQRGLLSADTRNDQNAIADALYDHLERTLDPVA